MICEFPTCSTHAIAGKKYCVPHNRIYGTVEIKVPKEIKKESAKTKDAKKELKKLYPRFLAKNKRCQIKSPVCTKKATCVHHTQGRGEAELLDQKTWKASCEACNGYVEQNHAWAEERGSKVSRHKIAS